MILPLSRLCIYGFFQIIKKTIYLYFFAVSVGLYAMGLVFIHDDSSEHSSVSGHKLGWMITCKERRWFMKINFIINVINEKYVAAIWKVYIVWGLKRPLFNIWQFQQKTNAKYVEINKTGSLLVWCLISIRHWHCADNLKKKHYAGTPFFSKFDTSNEIGTICNGQVWKCKVSLFTAYQILPGQTDLEC